MRINVKKVGGRVAAITRRQKRDVTTASPATSAATSVWATPRSSKQAMTSLARIASPSIEAKLKALRLTPKQSPMSRPQLDDVSTHDRSMRLSPAQLRDTINDVIGKHLLNISILSKSTVTSRRSLSTRKERETVAINFNWSPVARKLDFDACSSDSFDTFTYDSHDTCTSDSCDTYTNESYDTLTYDSYDALTYESYDTVFDNSFNAGESLQSYDDDVTSTVGVIGENITRQLPFERKLTSCPDVTSARFERGTELRASQRYPCKFAMTNRKRNHSQPTLQVRKPNRSPKDTILSNDQLYENMTSHLTTANNCRDVRDTRKKQLHRQARRGFKRQVRHPLKLLAVM